MNSFEEIKKILSEVAGEEVNFSLDKPEDLSHGDYATNIAFAMAKKPTSLVGGENISPKDCAEKLKEELGEKLVKIVSKIEIAGPGFINFFVKDDIRLKEVIEISKEVKNLSAKNQTALVEYTDPNCFKLFHIGHLMANTIGEAVSRLYEIGGYKVLRVCYPSDIGRNVAMGVWGVMQKESERPSQSATLKEKIEFLGMCYAFAHDQFIHHEYAQKEIVEVNKAIYDGSDIKIMEVYAEGRALSLEYFDNMYVRLGTTFDKTIFESEVSEEGLLIVQEYLKSGLFEESEGAIVYKGEQDGLHTRVFVNSQGLPTYEAKELGNYEKKLKLIPDAYNYVVITANEQNEYFKVVNKVEEKIHPELIGKLIHIGHGMLRLPTGKMSSRTGDVISGDDLLAEVADKIGEKVSEMKVEEKDKEKLINDISVGAIKFSILKQAIGRDIIFDFDKSISFEGDSGPYLQYTHARLCALLDKAQKVGIDGEIKDVKDVEVELERLINNYTQVIEKAFVEIAPHHILQYLLSLTRSFNNMYGRVQIIDENNKENSIYAVMLTKAVKNILAHGLNTLGIVAPKRM